jgi:uncharacterized protein YndB with AHSA1/START domain
MDVGTFTRSIRIGRPIDEVWSVLADIGSIADWNPGVVASRTTTGQFQGEGAGRFCDLGRRMHLDEVVTEWLPPQRITFSIVETNLCPGHGRPARWPPAPSGGSRRLIDPGIQGGGAASVTGEFQVRRPSGTTTVG